MVPCGLPVLQGDVAARADAAAGPATCAGLGDTVGGVELRELGRCLAVEEAAEERAGKRVFGAYVYYVYRWLFDNLRLEGYAVRWNARFWPTFGMFLGQTLLTVITLFIYYPTAYLRMYRYIAQRIVVKEGEGSEPLTHATLEFDGPLGRGFLLMWGQGLLSLITAGIYYPWALARVGRWLASHTSVVTR